MQLHKILEKEAAQVPGSRPEVFNFKKNKDKKKAFWLFTTKKILRTVDDYAEQLKEHFFVKNPSKLNSPDINALWTSELEKITSKTPIWQQGKWVYYPWNSTLVHVLDEKEFFEVRSARNKNLITKEEQENFYRSTVGVAGLSVGNSVALAIVLQGGARHIKIADHDRLALSNTNRIRSGIEELGSLKTEMTARQIYSLNPYAKVEIFPEGLNKKNIGKFFSGLDVVIDEVDNLAVKFLIREQAKKQKLPVVMAADNGDNGVIDIERYDKNPKLKFFHGRMGKVTYEGLFKLNKFGIGKTITKHIGPENVTEKMQDSLLSIGKTIVSWPQLGGAALLNGSAVAYCVRKILNNQPIENNRAIVSLDEKMIPKYLTAKQKQKRIKTSKNFAKIFGL